jgi:hypothetical protein
VVIGNNGQGEGSYLSTIIQYSDNVKIHVDNIEVNIPDVKKGKYITASLAKLKQQKLELVINQDKKDFFTESKQSEGNQVLVDYDSSFDNWSEKKERTTS